MDLTREDEEDHLSTVRNGVLRNGHHAKLPIPAASVPRTVVLASALRGNRGQIHPAQSAHGPTAKTELPGTVLSERGGA